ncbi:MAG: hypothetical protein ACI8P3_002636 [Saprospiraceae bacterium]|jgi:hypothetical protein
MLKFFAYSVLFGVFVCMLSPSCTGEKNTKKNIKAYYYPVAALKEPLVYEYRPVNNDTLGTEYYYFMTIETDTATYFTTNIYNQFFEVEQFSVEEVVSNGMLQKDYFLYITDTTGRKTRIPAEIEYGNTFPFEVKDSTGVFLQKMKWVFSEEPLYSTTLIRNRRYIGEKQYQYKGTDYDAVMFSLRELVDDFNDGHLETQTSGIEVYAKGIGLVYYKKNISKNLILEYELVDQYTMAELEEKFKSQ